MRLSTTDIYAFKALGYLGSQPEGQFVGSEELSQQTGVGRTYLVRILSALVAYGLVASRKGAGGGYALPRPAAQINLADVMRAVDGPIAPLACVSLNWPKDCLQQGCCQARSRIWLRVRDAVLQVLSLATVADLAADFAQGLDYSDCLDHLLHASEFLGPRGESS